MSLWTPKLLHCALALQCIAIKQKHNYVPEVETVFFPNNGGDKYVAVR